MKCPNDGHALKSVEFKSVRIHECPHCKGKWFDREELRKAKDSTDDALRWLDFDIFSDASGKYDNKVSDKKCPRDGSEMSRLTYMDSKIVIDKCNVCEGVWLDNHEFEKIIKYLENIVVTMPASEYEKETIKEFSEILTGPENRISELKDFLSVANLFTARMTVETPWMEKLSEDMYKYWPIH